MPRTLVGSLAGGLALGFACLLPGPAAGQTAPSNAAGWRFTVTPYAWLPSIAGDLSYEGPSLGALGAGGASVGVDSASVLEALDFAAMLVAEARNGRFSIVTDYIYLDLGSDRSRLRSADFGTAGRIPVSAGTDAGTESSVRGHLWTLAGGYMLASGDWGHVDAIGGFRLLSISARTDVRLAADVAGPGPGLSVSRAGRLSRDANLFDGIVGLRGRFILGGGFHVPYAVDLGTGGSRLTWQAAGGIGYQTGWAGVTLGYRHLSYDQQGDGLLQDFSFSGPYLGLNLTF